MGTCFRSQRALGRVGIPSVVPGLGKNHCPHRCLHGIIVARASGSTTGSCWCSKPELVFKARVLCRCHAFAASSQTTAVEGHDKRWKGATWHEHCRLGSLGLLIWILATTSLLPCRHRFQLFRKSRAQRSPAALVFVSFAGQRPFLPPRSQDR